MAILQRAPNRSRADTNRNPFHNLPRLCCYIHDVSVAILAVAPALGHLSKTQTGFKIMCHVFWGAAKRGARDGNVAGKAWCEQVLDVRQLARRFHELGQPRAVCFIVRERDEATEVRQSRILFRVLICNSQQEVILPSANGSRFPLSGKLKAEKVGR